MARKSKAYGPALGNLQTPDYYLRIKQNIDGLSDAIAGLQDSVAKPSKLTSEQLLQVQQSLQATGPNPLNLNQLLGVVSSLNGLQGVILIKQGAGIVVTSAGQVLTVALPNVGPGAGTYTVGAKLTVGGVNGTITLDAQGRVTAVQQAT